MDTTYFSVALTIKGCTPVNTCICVWSLQSALPFNVYLLFEILFKGSGGHPCSCFICVPPHRHPSFRSILKLLIQIRLCEQDKQSSTKCLFKLKFSAAAPWVLTDTPRPAGKCTLVPREGLPSGLLPYGHAWCSTSSEQGTWRDRFSFRPNQASGSSHWGWSSLALQLPDHVNHPHVFISASLNIGA